MDRPRPARRLNHAFKYLYRHDFDEATMSADPILFLQEQGGYSREQIIEMNRTFPPLLTLSVRRQLYPKLQFLKHTLHANNNMTHLPSSSSSSSSLSSQYNATAAAVIVPPQFFGARLERILAPRHAFLVYANLQPYGKDLLHNNNNNNNTTLLFHDFLLACRQPKRFAALCTSWRQRQLQQQQQHGASSSNNNNNLPNKITSRHIEAFDALFARGLMAAARDELVQWNNNTWPLDYLPNITSAELLELLIQHGACPTERDHRGVTLLHWACGTGNLQTVQCLIRHLDHCTTATAATTTTTAITHNNDNQQIGGGSSSSSSSSVWLTTDRDHATPLHWAAAGANSREFGTGGHEHICRYLLEQVAVAGDNKCRAYVNQCTLDGNSALMWAAWSGSLNTVKLLVRHRAVTDNANRNGCTVAHWAASGGSLQVCKYLADIVGVDFSTPNHGGNTPLTHAVAFGRTDIVEWLRNEVLVDGTDDQIAFGLAQDFVHWTDGDDRRKQVLKLFEDWYAYEDETGGGQDSDDDNKDDDLL